MGDALEALRIVCILIANSVPRTAQEIWRRIGMTGDVADRRIPVDTAWGGYTAGAPVEKGDPLFPRRTVA